MISAEMEHKVLELSALDRIHLVELVMGSLDKPDGSIQEAWADEADRRSDAFRSGKLSSRPYDEVMASVTKKR